VATYTYTQGSYVQLGFVEQRNATDVIAPDLSGRITLDQESKVVFAAVNHQLTPKLLASLTGNWQYSTYNEGAWANESDTLYYLGLNLSYRFNPHFSADIGYDYDRLDSQIPGRNYARNRVYFGATAAY
jgi:uncharacterized protein (PEP-CTERM system associated)